MTIDQSLVVVSRDGGVAILTLASAATGNALSIAMAESLAAAVDEAASDAAVRCVLLTGDGRYFCVGGDVKGMAAEEDVGAFLDRITGPLHQAVATLLRMDKPFVVAVNGPVAGGGLGLAIAGDIVVAAESAHFSMAYSGIGFSPDGASTWLLPRLVGLRRAQELALLNRRLSSVEALAAGLVTRVVTDAELATDALETARKLAAGPVGAFAATRRLLFASDTRSPETQMAAEARSVRAQAEGPEGREGVAAFVAKRKPEFVAEERQDAGVADG